MKKSRNFSTRDVRIGNDVSPKYEFKGFDLRGKPMYKLTSADKKAIGEISKGADKGTVKISADVLKKSMYDHLMWLDTGGVEGVFSKEIQQVRLANLKRFDLI